jgi:hypothetical protein
MKEQSDQTNEIQSMEQKIELANFQTSYRKEKAYSY